MGLHFNHRKFIKYAIRKASEEMCSEACESSDDSGICYTACAKFCYDKCEDSPYLYPPPPPPPASSHHLSKSRKFLIISVTLLAAAFLALLCYAIYVKLYLGWYSSRRRSRSDRQAINQTHDDFVDEDHGPVVDHHVWYIQTVGLQPSVINSITVCKYKRGDGLVEGTECSICLGEFQEDETLRLLPKCNHAFHIPCIDTWLRSHTNCPMCRAPIIKNSARASSSSASNTANSSSRLESGDARIQVLEENDETETRLGDELLEEEMVEVGIEDRTKRSENSEDEMQPMRRSVSLDHLSALKISQALTNPNTQLAEDVDLSTSTEIVPKRVSRNDSLARIVGTSSIRRSLSCSGKLFLSRSGQLRS